MTTTQTTTLNRVWFIKRFLLFMIGLLALGAWGLVDATVVYPRNGRLAASLRLKDYLQAADESRRLAPSTVKVDDPTAALRSLSQQEVGATGSAALTPLERSRLEWLRSLKSLWALDTTDIWLADVKRPVVSKTGDQVYSGVGGVSDVKKETVSLYYNPRTAEGAVVAADLARQSVPVEQVYTYLKEYWATAKSPSPLAVYDLPLQWLFVVAGFGGALYLFVLFLRVAAKKFRFEPETHTLIMPDGRRIAPGDVAEFDKRKWHKFFVTLQLKDDKAVTLDLYRYDPLEDWVLSMEKVAFPDSRPAEDTGDGVEHGPDVLAAPADLGKVAAMNYGGIMDGQFAMFLFDGSELSDAAAYAQGEVLKSLGVALRDEGGWRQWLCAAAGPVTGRMKATMLDMLAERHATFKSDLSRLREPASDLSARVAGEAFTGYLVVVGRVAPEVGARAHELLLDPPANGYLGVAMVRLHPPTIDGIAGPLGFESGMEIKGGTLLGAWSAPAEDVEQAGLRMPSDDPAAA